MAAPLDTKQMPGELHRSSTQFLAVESQSYILLCPSREQLNLGVCRSLDAYCAMALVVRGHEFGVVMDNASTCDMIQHCVLRL